MDWNKENLEKLQKLGVEKAVLEDNGDPFEMVLQLIINMGDRIEKLEEDVKKLQPYIGPIKPL